MPNIRGSLVHVGPPPPKPPPRGKYKRAGDRAKKRGRDAFFNTSSKPAEGFRNKPSFRTRPKKEFTEEQKEIAPSLRILGGTAGFVAGSSGGTAVGNAYGKKKHPDAKKIAKARYIKITTMGTMADRTAKKTPKRARQYPGLPIKSTIGGIALGGSMGVAAGYDDQKSKARLVQQQRKKKAMITKRLNATKEERHKALIGDKDYLPKKLGGTNKYNDTEKKVGARIIGRERLKGQAKGYAVGAPLGAAAGVGAAVATKGKSLSRLQGGVAGGLVGGAVGQFRGDYVGNVKGRRKVKQVVGKSASVSAFGVDHG